MQRFIQQSNTLYNTFEPHRLHYREGVSILFVFYQKTTIIKTTGDINSTSVKTEFKWNTRCVFATSLTWVSLTLLVFSIFLFFYDLFQSVLSRNIWPQCGTITNTKASPNFNSQNRRSYNTNSTYMTLLIWRSTSQT